MNVTVLTTALEGVRARLVRVEAKIRHNGMPGFKLVGLGDMAVRESRVRVLTVLDEAGYGLSDRNITVNLAPASLPKSGTSLDLPIAVGLLGAAGVVPGQALESTLLMGELGLKGSLRPVRGVLPAAIAARDLGLSNLIVPAGNASEACWVRGVTVYAAREFSEVVEHLAGSAALDQAQRSDEPRVCPPDPDLSRIRGQETAKRALEIAASGGHNILLVGPPGSGKTMLARAFAAILPPLNEREALETAAVHSVAGLFRDADGIRLTRPFRAPHHSISHAGLVGGGTIPRPGEVSLAHNGVLFLDELPEFGAYALDLLREPLEEGSVTVVRMGGSVRFPARVMLVGAMNPCRCGHHQDARRACRCSPQERRRYTQRVSGPLLDRFDMRIDVPSLSYAELTSGARGESSHAVADRVLQARAVQTHRWQTEGLGEIPNSMVAGDRLEKSLGADRATRELVRAVVERTGMSARGYTRMLRLARTIADMDGVEDVEELHVAEAVQYCRSLWDFQQTLPAAAAGGPTQEVRDVENEAHPG